MTDPAAGIARLRKIEQFHHLRVRGKGRSEFHSDQIVVLAILMRDYADRTEGDTDLDLLIQEVEAIYDRLMKG